MEDLKVIIPMTGFPGDYTCDGDDKSPPVEIGGVNPDLTQSLAIIVNDPDAPSGVGFVHWTAWNLELIRVIPENVPKTPMVSIPIRAVQGTNSFGKIGYNGPCPREGSTHRYFFKVYGLNTELLLDGGATMEELIQAMHGHVIQYGETCVTYGR